MRIVESYLNALQTGQERQAGTAELSFHTPLRNLLDAVGKLLSPRVETVGELKDLGAGRPDIGLFLAAQGREQPVPDRGVVEVKKSGVSLEATAQGDQVRKYLTLYRQVLVTNLWSFAIVTRGEDGAPLVLERFALAENERAFWEAAAQPHALAQARGSSLVEFLRRALLHPVLLSRPQDVAWLLASYARDALARLGGQEVPGLRDLRVAMEQALGLTFEAEQGDSFFRSTFIQTLFYGIFSGWVLWHRAQPTRTDTFRWAEAGRHLHVPILQELFERMTLTSKLHALGLLEVLDWVQAGLNRVDRAEFFTHFVESEAVQYFYEPFLEAFSPDLRRDLGVWYTPTEIVTYMVEQVDRALRDELGVEDGLANERVYVLDPASGTGAYPVAVLRKIAAIYQERGQGALAGAAVKKAAMYKEKKPGKEAETAGWGRVMGFEVLTAPFVIAHLQVGLLLQSLNAPLGPSERPAIFLTNALTGWDLTRDQPKDQPIKDFPGFEAERSAALDVKQKEPILVILGNPPYNAFAGVSPMEEEGLVEPYKEGLRERWGIRKYNLDDLYIRFFRLAEFRIAERRMEGAAPQGVVCYISNFSYLSDPSFVVMREHLLGNFDLLRFDALNGDSRETGKRTPDGQPDPSVFSTRYNKAGIRVGTAIALLARGNQRAAAPTVGYREFWGVGKRQALLESLDQDSPPYLPVEPTARNRYRFRPHEVSDHYLEWPALPDLAAVPPISGLQEMRKGALIDIDKRALEERMQRYFDPSVNWDTLTELKSGFTQNAGGFEAQRAREKLLRSAYNPNQLIRYALLPFDIRWAYYSDQSPLWNRPRPELMAQSWEGNRFLVTRMASERPREQIVITMTTPLPDYHLLRPNAVAIPLWLRETNGAGAPHQGHFIDEMGFEQRVRANLSAQARGYLAALGLPEPDEARESAEALWFHALAIGFAPDYLEENAEGIRADWPRVPLPAHASDLLASAALGRHVAALLDTESGVPGVTTGRLRPAFRGVAEVARDDGAPLDPATDLALTARWGYLQGGTITMPGQGSYTERAYSPDELTALAAEAEALGLSPEMALAQLGDSTVDVYLNDRTFWRNVPAQVWAYTIGGHQVLKKWLSYRDQAVLARPLHVEEIIEVTQIARRLTAILLLQPALNAAYHAAATAPFPWHHTESGT